MKKRTKEKLLYFIIPIAVVIITGLYMCLFYVDMFRLGTHFAIKDIKIENGSIIGSAKNVGSFDVKSVIILATLRENDGSLREVTIPLNPKDLEVGEEVEFKKEIPDYQRIDTGYIRAIIKTK